MHNNEGIAESLHAYSSTAIYTRVSMCGVGGCSIQVKATFSGSCRQTRLQHITLSVQFQFYPIFFIFYIFENNTHNDVDLIIKANLCACTTGVAG